MVRQPRDRRHPDKLVDLGSVRTIRCYFVTAVVSGITIDGLNTAWRSAGVPAAFRAIGNPYIQKQLAPGESYALHLARDGCDCGTWLGKARREKDYVVGSGPAEVDKALAKVKKRSWSQARIARWVDQQLQEYERLDEEIQTREQAEREAHPWVDVVRTALAAGATRFGLVLHWYHAGIETADFTLARENLPPAALTTHLLDAMAEDTLYSFARR